MRMAAGHRVTHRVFRRSRIVNRTMPRNGNRGQGDYNHDPYLLIDSDGYAILDSNDYLLHVKK